MTTPLPVLRESLYEQMDLFGFDREDDAELYEYAERWSLSNQWLDVSPKVFFDMFIDSYGVSTYQTFGFVPEDDD